MTFKRSVYSKSFLHDTFEFLLKTDGCHFITYSKRGAQLPSLVAKKNSRKYTLLCHAISIPVKFESLENSNNY